MYRVGQKRRIAHLFGTDLRNRATSDDRLQELGQYEPESYEVISLCAHGSSMGERVEDSPDDLVASTPHVFLLLNSFPHDPDDSHASFRQLADVLALATDKL